MKWKILSSQYLYKEDWFTVRKDRCQTPQGKIVDPYYVFEYPNWANAVPITREGEIILIRQYRHALAETIWEIPGGVIEDSDQSPEEGMKRELLEETGYSFDSLIPLGDISPNPSTNTNLTYMYLAKGGIKVQDQQLDPNEEIDVALFKPEEVLDLLLQKKIRQSLHASCLFYAFLQMGMLTTNRG